VASPRSGPSDAADPESDLYLGIDFGTSGCRGILIDAAGRESARAAEPIPAPERRGAGVEQDPQLWWRALERVIAALDKDADLSHLAAIAVDGTSATLLLTDSLGHPLGPALLYNDARATAEAAAVAALAPADSAAFGASSSLSKLLWLQAHGHTERACHVLHQAEWIGGRLLGRFDMGDENNCLKLGWDAVRREWPAWLQGLDIDRSLLPRVVPPGTPTGGMVPEVAEGLGLRPDTRIVAGTTDSTAAFLATGASEPGDAVTSLGSTLVLKILAEHPVASPRHGVYSHRLGDRWLVGGASNSGGAVLRRWFSDAQMRRLGERINPDRPTGLDYYPLPAPGERFPVADPGMPPRLQPRPEDPAVFFQGLLEGIAAIERDGYALLASLGAGFPKTVRSVGGGASNPAWRRIRAARLGGVPLLEPAHSEAAYGAALLAREGG
jgi:sugar (pentulose or hexulose) kinase